MKRIILAVAGAVVFATSTYAVEPYAFGVKAGFVNSNLTNFLKGKEVNMTEEKAKDYEDNFFNPGGMGSLYGEYAFHDMVGAGLEAGYFYGMADSYKKKEAKKEGENKDNKNETYRNLMFQAIKISPYVAVYAMGREDKADMGSLDIKVYGDLYIPLSAEWSGKDNGTDLTTAQKEIKKENLASFGIGAGLGVGYEFPFGLITELKGGMAFTDFWKAKDSGKKEEGKKDDKKEEKSNLWNLGFAVGFNIATLLEE